MTAPIAVVSGSPFLDLTVVNGPTYFYKVAAYNAGHGNVDRWVQAAGGTDSFEIGDIRFPETRAYVANVLDSRGEYREHYRDELQKLGRSDPGPSPFGENRVVAGNRLYGRTVQLLSQQLSRFGVHTDFIDVNDPDQVRTALLAPADVLHVETVSNPLLRVPDLPALAEIAHAAGCRMVVDNTFATPVLTRPLDLGADLVMESLTKMIGGHADVTLGLLALSGHARYWHVAVVAVLWGIMTAVDQPARQSLVMELVGREHLSSAVGLNSVTFNGARIVGPAIVEQFDATTLVPAGASASVDETATLVIEAKEKP